ncbi:MAG: hypothetical protein FRX49_01936 [Trebouxia sp. A1-2]|nr:MAG: hypothetical protein FRX49_01936 [Trebouxia sp. A1-2]
MEDRPQPGESWQDVKPEGTGVKEDRMKGGPVQLDGNAKMLADGRHFFICSREETWRRLAWMMAQNSENRWMQTQMVGKMAAHHNKLQAAVQALTRMEPPSVKSKLMTDDEKICSSGLLMSKKTGKPWPNSCGRSKLKKPYGRSLALYSSAQYGSGFDVAEDSLLELHPPSKVFKGRIVAHRCSCIGSIHLNLEGINVSLQRGLPSLKGGSPPPERGAGVEEGMTASAAVSVTDAPQVAELLPSEQEYVTSVRLVSVVSVVSVVLKVTKPAVVQAVQMTRGSTDITQGCCHAASLGIYAQGGGGQKDLKQSKEARHELRKGIAVHTTNSVPAI